MALHNTPEQHEADPPSGWRVVKTGPRSWELRSAFHQPGDGALSYRPTRTAAEADRVSGHLVDLYEREGRWFRGEPVAGWKPYAALPAAPGGVLVMGADDDPGAEQTIRSLLTPGEAESDWGIEREDDRD